MTSPKGSTYRLRTACVVSSFASLDWTNEHRKYTEAVGNLVSSGLWILVHLRVRGSAAGSESLVLFPTKHELESYPQGNSVKNQTFERHQDCVVPPSCAD